MTTFIYAPEFWIGSWAGFVTWTCFMLMWRVARAEVCRAERTRVARAASAVGFAVMP